MSRVADSPGRPDVASGRAGTSVAEALVALVLGLFLTTLALRVVAQQRAAVAALAQESDALATVRVARQVLGREGRSSDPVRDGWAVSNDSLGIRAFRGMAYVCGAGPSPDEVWVEAEGVRLPQPAKDSVLVLDANGAWTAFALLDAGSAADCSPGGRGQGQRWRLSGLVPSGAALTRYFERGSYHVADAALRYRRGASGRQPLTPETVRTPPSVFLRTPTGVTLLLDVEGSAPPWRVLVFGGAVGPDG